MKFTNIKQLLINFKGGGLINFPFKHLKEVDIDGDTDEQSGGGSSTPLTKLDTIKNYVNLLYDRYNIEFDVVEETSTEEIEVEDENEEPTGETATITQKHYKFVPKTSVPRVYLDKNNSSGSTSLGPDNGLALNAGGNSPSDPTVISKIILDDTELTIQQLINYDIVQVGIAKFNINFPNEPEDYAGYLEYLDWIRNNTMEDVEIPILLYGEPTSDTTKGYYSSGLISSRLFLNANKANYSQTVLEVLIPEQ